MQAFLEAEAYPGPSLIIAYSHCIAHGYDMAHGAEQQKLAVDSGVWPLYRFDPAPRRERASRRCTSTRGPPKAKVADYMRNETRFRMVERADPARFKRFVEESRGARPGAATPSTSSSPGSPCRRPSRRSDERRRPPADRREGGAHEPRHDVPGLRAAAPAHRRARARSPTTSTRCARLEDAGAAAIVLRSLFEEQITGEQMAAFFHSESHGESFAEATSYSPEPRASRSGPEEYLEHLRRVKAAVAVPVIASLNGTTPAAGLATPASSSRRARTPWS